MPSFSLAANNLASVFSSASGSKCSRRAARTEVHNATNVPAGSLKNSARLYPPPIDGTGCEGYAARRLVSCRFELTLTFICRAHESAVKGPTSK
jgi:hypothetical protein